eukprot:491781-Pleurochrysis_carterae.AAC.1
MPPRYVGGYNAQIQAKGFPFPKLFHENNAPPEAWRVLRPADDKTRIAPFFGTEVRQTPQQNGVFPKSLIVHHLCEQMHGALGGVVHRPIHDLYFGFNVPKAHWLYPHYIPSGAEAEVRPNSIRLPAGAHHAPTPLNAYQQWP